jgi:hypothetical protein
VVIYAEFSIGYTRIEEVEQVLSDGLKSEKFHERHYFLPVRCFSGIEHEEDIELGCCPISSSVRTRRWLD